MVEADRHIRLLPKSKLDISKVFELLTCCLKGICVHPYTNTQAKLAQDFQLWGTCGMEMMWLHHGWGWYPLQTASHIHIRHIKCVWAIGIWSQGHMDAPLYHYTSKVGPRFWNLGHLWSENDAITSWLRLTSTSDCFPHPYTTYKMCLRYYFAVSRAYGCTFILLYSKLAPDFKCLGHLWSGNDAITWWLRLICTSDCFPN